MFAQTPLETAAQVKRRWKRWQQGLVRLWLRKGTGEALAMVADLLSEVEGRRVTQDEVVGRALAALVERVGDGDRCRRGWLTRRRGRTRTDS